MPKYKPIRATFDNVKVGDKIKRHGITFYVYAKTEENGSGYVELRMIAEDVYDFSSGRATLWNKKDFDNRKFNYIIEPEVKTYNINDLKEGGDEQKS